MTALLERARSTYAEVHARFTTAADAIENADESADLDELQRTFDEVEIELRAAQAEVARAETVQRARELHPAPDPVGDPILERQGRSEGDARVTRNEPIYRQDSNEFTFFRDLVATKNGDGEARARLMRNNAEYIDHMRAQARAHPNDRNIQQRAGLTQAAGAGGEFIAPVWYIEQTQQLLRAGRAFADQCTGNPLPEFTNSINVPKITTGASTTVSADAAAVSNTDLVTTSVTAQVQTVSGRTVAAYQDIDLGGPIVEQLIYEDLLADYWRTYDTSLISGNVTNAKGFLNVTGINAVTYTDATPTGPELYLPVMQAKNGIEKGAFAGVDFSLWHPSTWNWYLSQLDTANRPLALSQSGAAFNAMASFNSEAQGVAGNIAGIPVVVDGNVPVNLGGGTNEARIGFFNRRTLVTYEGVPRFRVADQTNIANLQYQFVLYGYYGVAFPRQPKMISVVAGTGLIVQAGF